MTSVLYLKDPHGGYNGKLIANKNEMADVVFVPYVDYVNIIGGALSATRNKETSMLVVHVNCDVTAMVAFALIGKHLNQTAVDIKASMISSGMVDFKEKSSKGVWNAIVEKYKLRVKSVFIDDTTKVEKDAGAGGLVKGESEREEEEEEGDGEDEDDEDDDEEDKGAAEKDERKEEEEEEDDENGEEERKGGEKSVSVSGGEGEKEVEEEEEEEEDEEGDEKGEEIGKGGENSGSESEEGD